MKRKKRLFKVTGFIAGIGPIEEYKHEYSPQQAVRVVALDYEKKCPGLRIFIEDRRVYEKINNEWVQVWP